MNSTRNGAPPSLNTANWFLADLFGRGSHHPEALRIPATRPARCGNSCGAATRRARLGLRGAASQTIIRGQGAAQYPGHACQTPRLISPHARAIDVHASCTPPATLKTNAQEQSANRIPKI